MRNKAKITPKTKRSATKAAMAEQLFSYSREHVFLRLMILLVFLLIETILGIIAESHRKQKLIPERISCAKTLSSKIQPSRSQAA